MHPVTVIYYDGNQIDWGWAFWDGQIVNNIPTLFQATDQTKTPIWYYLSQTQLTDTDFIVNALIAGHEHVLWICP